MTLLNSLNEPHAAGGSLREVRVPTRWQALWFQFRARCFQGRRFLRGLWEPRVRRFARMAVPEDGVVIGKWGSDLWSQASTPVERKLQLGKVQNLRAAAARLDGIVIPAGETFSFWKQVGRPVRRRGFAVGRELREGCL